MGPYLLQCSVESLNKKGIRPPNFNPSANQQLLALAIIHLHRET